MRLRRVVRVALHLNVLLAVSATWGAAFWVLSFPLAAVLYIAPGFAGHRLKDIPYFKSGYVPACWCSFIGSAAAFGGIEIDTTLVVFSLFFFLRMVASCGIGDMRDLDLDRAAGVRTIAVALGHTGARWGVELVQALSIAGIVLAAIFGLVPTGAACLVIPAMFGYASFRSFLANPRGSELVLELYDLELVAYAPVLYRPYVAYRAGCPQPPVGSAR